MLQNIDLRELAEMQSSGRDFVSVYCQGLSGLQALKSRERNLIAILDDEPDEAEHFELSMQLVHDLLENNPGDVEGAESVCVFACGLLDFVRGHPLSLPVENQIYVGPSPFIRPLAELQDEYQTFAVVACDNDSTRIFLVTNTKAEVEEKVRGDIKNHVRKGGWSQQRYSRRRDNELQQYVRQVGEDLETLVKQHGLERIVLLGSQETITELGRELPNQLAEKVVGSQAFDLKRGDDELIEEAYEAYFAQERDAERNLWKRIKNEYKSNGLATTGATDVLDALKIGRADHVIVTRDAEISGTRCRDCDLVVHGTPDTCQACGSSSVFQVDLVDTIARQAELTSAGVEFSDEIKGLTRAGHVAALLRY